jgi:hypothetical protein
MAVTEPPGTTARLTTPAAEAARYALLRRLAPSMRHHLVVNLQPIGMIYEVMDRRLRATTPDLAHVQESAGKINGFAKAALNACIDVVGWLAPDESATTAVHDAAKECSGLLATSFSFRGYALRNQVGPVGGTIRRSSVRNLLSAALLHSTDQHAAPADVVLACAVEAQAAVLTLTLRATQGDPAIAPEANYRRITWDDLQALSGSEGVPVAREQDAIVLRFPWVDAP